jgi:hypothetical protein
MKTTLRFLAVLLLSPALALAEGSAHEPWAYGIEAGIGQRYVASSSFDLVSQNDALAQLHLAASKGLAEGVDARLTWNLAASSAPLFGAGGEASLFANDLLLGLRWRFVEMRRLVLAIQADGGVALGWLSLGAGSDFAASPAAGGHASITFPFGFGENDAPLHAALSLDLGYLWVRGFDFEPSADAAKGKIAVAGAPLGRMPLSGPAFALSLSTRF